MQRLFLCLACLAVAAALPQCNRQTVDLPGDRMTFAVVGDWGRVGAIDSLFAPSTVKGCGSTGQCCSSLQDPTFPDSFDYSDALDGPQQRFAATLLDEVCGMEDCQFILGMGDNFYPCGADPLNSGLNRFVSDWENLYHSPSTPNIANLKWYHVVGNHDYGFNTSVNLQRSFAQLDDRWVFPDTYYAMTFRAGNVSFNVEFLDEVPFIATYAHPKPNKAYYTNYLAGKITPSFINSDAAAYLNATSGICNVPAANASFIDDITDGATGQIPWLKSCLESSNATWNAIVGHFALYGSDVNWAQPSNKTQYPGNCGAFGSLINLIQDHNIDAYFNGHDHTQTHADPTKSGVLQGVAAGYGNLTYTVSGSSRATQYFTLGNGGSIQYADGVTPAKPKFYNDFSSVIYNSNVQYPKAQITDDASDNAAVGEGFAIVHIDGCTMQVKFYNIGSYETPDNTRPTHTTVINKCSSPSVTSAGRR